MSKVTKSPFLYFDPSLEEGVVRLWGGQPGFELPDICQLSELTQYFQEQNINSAHLVIPGELVHSSTLTLPNRAALKALPFLLEERLSEAVEEVHIVHSPVQQLTTTVFAVSQNQLDDYLNQLEGIGISAISAYADYQLVPELPDSLNTCNLGERTLLRQPDGTGCAVRNEFLEKFQEKLQENHSNEKLLQSNTSNFSDLDIENFKGVSLLQGAYQPANSDIGVRWKRHAISTAAAILIMALGYFVVAGWFFHQKADGFQKETEAQFLSLFPNTKNTVNIKRRMQGYLKGQTSQPSDGQFIDLIARCAPALNSPHQVRYLRFDQQQGALQLEVQSNNNESINQLRQALEAAELDAKVLSSNKNDAGVLARIQVSEG
ncbi:type II secretion system protein GspL [Porticoccus sp. W117]|uniref:type II secretion system protein GspL n=1 Tax=Porticoccus sp. W117 TaxID=3054777 RepID=UPI0025915FFF|nr:type II secretion system protein GspL [Porticoccus sp. W117]MDM3872563.1 type II secretion system protein GspL [Porticoccus sp. W117]